MEVRGNMKTWTSEQLARTAHLVLSDSDNLDDAIAAELARQDIEKIACESCGGTGEGPDELEFGNECVQKPCRTCNGKGLKIP